MVRRVSTSVMAAGGHFAQRAHARVIHRNRIHMDDDKNARLLPDRLFGFVHHLVDGDKIGGVGTSACSEASDLPAP